MHVLIGSEPGQGPLSDEQLDELYAAPAAPWLRVNMVSTLDGAATGESGRSGSINNAADKRVFDALRRRADAVVVGAGTARVEGYRPVPDKPLVVLTRSGALPEPLLGASPGSVLAATSTEAPGLERLRADLGAENVLVHGADQVDLVDLKAALAERGLVDLLSEGGPHLFADLLRSGAADELCLTTVPRLIAGEHLRITAGAPLDVHLEPRLLLADGGTLLGRWDVLRSSNA